MNSISRLNIMRVRPFVAVNFSNTCVKSKDNSENVCTEKNLSIPPYTERTNEDIIVKKARLLYQSRKRGMLENGLLLSTFAKKYLDNFNETELQLYDRLINLPSNDWDLFYWATGIKPTPSEFNHEVMDLLKEHIQNKDRQARIVQPEL